MIRSKKYTDAARGEMCKVNIARLKSIVAYDTMTGFFTYIPQPRSEFESSHAFKMWNGKYAGKRAGHKDGSGYWNVSIDGVVYKAHRLAWFYVYGTWPASQIDHINHVRTDNRLKNLREVGFKENTKNQKLRKTNTSGYVGVEWHKKNNRWRSTICIEGKRTSLGCFQRIEDAIAARKAAHDEYGFHKNHGEPQ